MGWDAPLGCSQHPGAELSPLRRSFVRVKLPGCGSPQGPDFFSEGYTVQLCVELGFFKSPLTALVAWVGRTEFARLYTLLLRSQAKF